MRDFAADAESCRLAGDAHGAIEIAEACLAQDFNNHRARIALALALIDVGDVSAARVALVAAFPQAAWAPVAPPPVPDAAPVEPAPLSEPAELSDDAALPAGLVPPPLPESIDGSLGDDELESAFANAETNPEEMMSANRVVEQTLEHEHTEVPEAGFDVTESPTYATETMALLLEEQGRGAQAEVLRSSLTDDLGDELEEDFPDDVLGSLPRVSDDMGGEDWARAGVGPDHANRVRIMTTLESWLYNIRNVRNRESESRAGGATSS